MQAADIHIHIDDVVYITDFQGFNTAMNAYTNSGTQIRLNPWTLNSHLAALGECVVPSGTGLELNEQAFSHQVLAENRIPENTYSEFAPMALWWASGGGIKPVSLGNNWYRIGSVLVQLRSWTAGERFSALAQSRLDTGDGTRFNVEAYLRSLLKACVVSLEPEQALANLDSAASCALLDAVITLNAVSLPDTETLKLTPETDRIILRLCRELAWTPSQVLAIPASELDVLLALLERTENIRSPSITPVSGLASYPDTVMILIEDD